MGFIPLLRSAPVIPEESLQGNSSQSGVNQGSNAQRGDIRNQIVYSVSYDMVSACFDNILPNL